MIKNLFCRTRLGHPSRRRARCVAIHGGRARRKDRTGRRYRARRRGSRAAAPLVGTASIRRHSPGTRGVTVGLIALAIDDVEFVRGHGGVVEEEKPVVPCLRVPRQAKRGKPGRRSTACAGASSYRWCLGASPHGGCCRGACRGCTGQNKLGSRGLVGGRSTPSGLV